MIKREEYTSLEDFFNFLDKVSNENSQEVVNKELSRKPDNVNSPEHYGGLNNPYETIKVIIAWGLDKDYFLANAIKYISRAGKKDQKTFIEDLEKAIWYLNKRIELKKEKI